MSAKMRASMKASMKLSFSTLGCPGWDLDTLCSRGRLYGFDGVDFRGYLDILDVTLHPAFTHAVTATRRQLDQAGLAVSGISSGITLCLPESQAANLEEARRTIALASALGSVNVRVFGGGDLSAHPREELVRYGCDCMERILALDGARDLHWLFETHDIWVRAQDCRLLLAGLPDPAFGVLWDLGNAMEAGSESPQEVLSILQGRVGYTHVKDVVHDPHHPQAMENGWRYVSPGMGQLPLAESIRLLQGAGYDGWLVFEHEKRWIPGLPEPEEAFPAFVSWARSLPATR